MDLVDAQQTRRIVDRLVGYTLSPLLSRKVRGGLSAGRVQSVAVRLVVEREREITRLHRPRVLDHPGDPRDRSGEKFPAEVVRIDGEALDIRDEETAEAHKAAIKDLHPGVTKVGTRTQKRSPAPPFTTSTLQQEASRRLSFSPRRTMSIAQRLYEGIETGGRPGRPHHLPRSRRTTSITCTTGWAMSSPAWGGSPGRPAHSQPEEVR